MASNAASTSSTKADMASQLEALHAANDALTGRIEKNAAALEAQLPKPTSEEGKGQPFSKRDPWWYQAKEVWSISEGLETDDQVTTLGRRQRFGMWVMTNIVDRLWSLDNDRIAAKKRVEEAYPLLHDDSVPASDRILGFLQHVHAPAQRRANDGEAQSF